MILSGRLLLRLSAVIAFLYSFPAFSLSKDPLSVALPEIEIMPGAEWYWVGRQMALNGIPMSIKMFTARAKSEDLIQFYRSAWKVRGHGKLREDRFGSRVILGFELDGFYFSVQFDEAKGGVQGKAVVTPVPSSYHSSKQTSLPLPPRSTVLSKVESIDAGRKEETLSIDTRFDVAYVVNFYKSQLLDDGWMLFSAGGDLQNSAVLNFQKGSELLQLTAKALHHNNSQQTQFLIHWIK